MVFRRLLLATVLFASVVLLEWWSELTYSLGIFYLFAIVVAATVATRWQIVIAAFITAYVRAQFAPAMPPIEWALRFAMAVFAYAGIGLFIVEMSRSRRAAQEGYTRLQLEQQLRTQAERRLASLVESSPAAIVTLDASGDVVAANRAACALFGDDVLSENLARRVPVYAGALAHPNPLRAGSATWAMRNDGTSFPVATWFSTYNDGDARFLAGILVDTSEEVRDREREAFRQLTDAQRLLAGAVSHEIRNLCSAIRVVTSNLARPGTLADNADFNALVTLVESLGAIAATQLDATRHTSPTVSLRSVLQQLRVVIDTDWSDAGGEVEWHLGDADYTVQADANALIQTFLNLTQNAARATFTRPTPRLTVAVKPQPSGVVVQFDDNGPGIEDASALFQPFRSPTHMPLGLFISRTLMRSFGGDLQHVPTEKGCRFDVTLSAA